MNNQEKIVRPLWSCFLRESSEQTRKIVRVQRRCYLREYSEQTREDSQGAEDMLAQIMLRGCTEGQMGSATDRRELDCCQRPQAQAPHLRAPA